MVGPLISGLSQKRHAGMSQQEKRAIIRAAICVRVLRGGHYIEALHLANWSFAAGQMLS